MVRGNWQKRVETAHDRRTQAKNKKIRKEQKALYKLLVQNQLFPLLNKLVLGGTTLEMRQLHVWVDYVPPKNGNSKNREEEEADESDSSRRNKKNKRKPKAASGPAKKVHPRSHETGIEDAAEEEVPLLCHQYFFTGSCPGVKSGKSKKKNISCEHVHNLSKRDLTLFDVLVSKNSKRNAQGLDDRDLEKAKDALKRASYAAALAQRKLDGQGAQTDTDTGANGATEKIGVDMVQYMSIPLIANQDEQKNASQIMLSACKDAKVNISSIAYVAYDNLLLFDRFDGGKVLSAEDEGKLSSGNQVIDQTSNCDAKSDEIINFPGTVLEHILTYLPAKYAGILPKVCKTFHQEIGTSSPALWKQLLERHGWPEPQVAHSCPIAHHKKSFLSHFRVSRRVESFASGLRTLVGDSDEINEGFALGNFQEMHDIPVDCSNITFWSENSIIFASGNSLCIHEVSGRKAREILRVRIIPVPLSKKVQCNLKSLALDDRYLICSFKVNEDYILSSMTKEDLLSNSTEDSIECGDVLQSHSLSTAFREFCNTSVKKDRIQFLAHAVDDCHYMDNIFVSMDTDLKPCGYGIFCAIVTISHRNEDEGLEEDILSSGLVSLCASKGRSMVLDYMQLPVFLRDSIADITTNYKLKKRTELTQITCKDFCRPDLFLTTIDRHGVWEKGRQLFEGLTIPVLDGHVLLEQSCAQTVRMPSKIVTSYLLQRDGGTKLAACTIYDLAEVPPKTVYLKQTYSSITTMQEINSEYLLLICKCDKSDDNPEHDFGGHWFGDDDGSAESANMDHIDFVIIHVPSASVIQSLTFLSSIDLMIDLDVAVGSEGSISGIIESVGICLSGCSRLGVESANDQFDNRKSPKSNKKMKKKKRLAAKTGKKDGFARGMSLRG